MSDEELAAEAGLSVEQVRQARDLAHVVASLDQPVGDGDAVLGDLVGVGGSPSAEQTAVEAVGRRELHRAVEELPPLQRAVVTARFGLDNGVVSSVAATARQLRVSERRIRDLESRALAALADAEGLAEAA